MCSVVDEHVVMQGVIARVAGVVGDGDDVFVHVCVVDITVAIAIVGGVAKIAVAAVRHLFL